MKRALVIALLTVAVSARADEGMWTLDNFPKDVLKEKYDVQIDDDWLKKVQLATTRVEGGCTGSFISPNGLVLTNHHCVTRCVSQISTAENDIAANGFLAMKINFSKVMDHPHVFLCGQF